MSTQPKLHHLLPEAYLRRFADERSELWVLDRKQGVPGQSPEVTVRSGAVHPPKTIAASGIGTSNGVS